MNKEILQFLTGMTEEQIINSAKSIGLDTSEEEAFKDGIDFLDKYLELEDNNSQQRVILKLLSYGILKNKGGK